MSIDADLYKLLANQHIGKSVTGAGSRVYPDVLPQNATYPAITYSEISQDLDYDLGGAGQHTLHRFSCMVSAKDKNECNTCVDAVIEALHVFSGTSFDTATETISLDNTIAAIFVSTSGSFFEDDIKVFTTEIELEIHTTY